MSVSIFLIILGGLGFFFGILLQIGRRRGRQTLHDFSNRNFGINFGGSLTQINEGLRLSAASAEPKKTDWKGILIASISLVTALVGLSTEVFKHLSK
jgi:hypothetical protein